MIFIADEYEVHDNINETLVQNKEAIMTVHKEKRVEEFSSKEINNANTQTSWEIVASIFSNIRTIFDDIAGKHNNRKSEIGGIQGLECKLPIQKLTIYCD